MASFKFDPIKHGLQKTLKEYEEAALRNIWSIGKKGMGARAAYLHQRSPRARTTQLHNL